MQLLPLYQSHDILSLSTLIKTFNFKIKEVVKYFSPDQQKLIQTDQKLCNLPLNKEQVLANCKVRTAYIGRYP